MGAHEDKARVDPRIPISRVEQSANWISDQVMKIIHVFQDILRATHYTVIEKFRLFQMQVIHSLLFY